MNKENIKKISEITYDIDNEYGLLIELSEKGKENTEEYNKNLDILFKLVEKLLSNCYQIPYENLEQILNYFNKSTFSGICLLYRFYFTIRFWQKPDILVKKINKKDTF